MNPSNSPKLLSPRLITQEILALRDEWVADGTCESYFAINSGYCIEFANTIQNRLEAKGYLVRDRLVDHEVAEFQIEDEEYTPGRPLDRQLLATHWSGVTPPQELSWTQLDCLVEDQSWDCGLHIWLTFDGMHYDSECPEGTPNFLELPLFARSITGWKEEQQLTTAPTPVSPKPRPRSPRRR